MSPKISIRPITETDIALITNYWLDADPDYLKGMGVDTSRMPAAAQWHEMLNQQINSPMGEKLSYALILLVNGEPSGHCNINKIERGQQAYMHLHLWHSEQRQAGLGSAMVQMAVPVFFDLFSLERIMCEPYALNAAPNKTLEKVGFVFVKKVTCIPGRLSFEQEVNLWELTLQRYKELYE